MQNFQGIIITVWYPLNAIKMPKKISLALLTQVET